ncbi:MAG: hypothetical protein IT442_09450 [Phycisphaeraceae bacterium]|nr:hypothetical protein [Phycisphaeraceae bacterium]
MKRYLDLLTKYVDKIVLAAAVVVAGLLIWKFSLGQPYSAQISAGRSTEEVSPSEVAERVTRAARQLELRLGSDTVPAELAEFKVADDSAAFVRKLSEPIAGSGRRFEVPLSEPGLALSEFRLDNSPLSMYEVPTPPAPKELATRAAHGVLSESMDPDRLAQVVALVGDQRPRDFRYVTVAGKIDLEAWEALLKSVSSGRQIPVSWQRNALYVVDVMLERQELDPATGRWGPTMAITPMPGQVTFRGVAQGPGIDASTLIQQVRRSQEDVLRPEFLLLDGGPPWVSPLSPGAVFSSEDAARLSQLNKEIERLTRQAAALQRRIDQQSDGGTRTAQPTQAAPPPTIDPIAQGLNANSSSGQTGRQPTQRTRQTPAEQLAEVRQLLQQKTQERDDMLAAARRGEQVSRAEETAGGSGGSPGVSDIPLTEEQALEEARRRFFGGASPDGTVAPTPSPTTPTPRPRRVTNPDAPLPKQQEFYVNDLTVQPGRTYRYRVTARMLNPLFSRQQNLAPEQKPQAEDLGLASEPSAWSEPVQVEPEHMFFLVGGSAEVQTANVEVYKLYDGVWRAYTFDNIHPGDVIGGARTKKVGDSDAQIDFGLGMVLVDLTAPSGAGGDTEALLLDLRTQRLAERSIRSDAGDPQREVYRNDELLWSTPQASTATP